ncbi:MAG: hypothetical protein V3U03_17525 [Myxococcota bacterium]
MTLADTVLFKVQDAIGDVVKAVSDNGIPVFGATPRVFFQGDALDTTVMSAALIEFAEETSDEVQTKFRHRLPWRCRVYFDSKAAGATTRARHTKLLGLMRDAIMAARILSGNAIDTHYLGGGSALRPEDEEESGDRWSFEVQCETLYGDKVLDSTTQA